MTGAIGALYVAAVDHPASYGVGPVGTWYIGAAGWAQPYPPSNP